MSIFEFVLTGFTLVLALVVTRLLGGLRWALDPERGYWVHSMLVILMLILASLIWWGLWYARNTQWTYMAFTYNLLIGPGMLFFTSSVLVPDNPRRVRNWREHYFKVHRMFYGAFVALVLLLFVGSVLFTGTPLWHVTRILQVLALVLCIVGIVSKRHGVHATLAILLSAIIVAAMVYSQMSSQNLPLDG